MADYSDQDQTATHVIIAPGVDVDQYRIVRRIGAGGMGEVFLADDSRVPRQVALKFLALPAASDPMYRKRFLREVQTAARLNHPNIVSIFDTGEFQSRAYFTMPFVEGRTFRELIDLGLVERSKIPHYVTQVCAGLQHAHEAGVVHRDIKPTNIVVDSQDHVTLLDFGLARIESEDSLTVVGTAVGTARYMSPEQAQGQPVDHRSDIFSLGIVLYELLTGVSPFSRGYEPAAMYAVVHERPKPLRHFKPELPGDYQIIIDRALAKRPERRYQSTSDMAEDIRRVDEGRALTPISGGTVADSAPPETAVAVMYFRNLGHEDDEYLSYGLTEDLIVDLSRLGTIRITPMRTALKYKDVELDLEEIAERLRVGRVLDGSIRKQGDSVHVAAQLIDAATGHTLWSDRRDEPVNNLPQIKQSFADALVNRLGFDTAPARSRVASHNPAAYEFYLRGKYLFEHRKDRADVNSAMGLYRKALRLDPSLLAARSGIAHVLIYNAEYQAAEQELTEALAEARSRGLQSEQAVLLQLFGRCRALVSRYDEANDLLHQSVRLSRTNGDLEGELAARTQLLMIIRMQGLREGADEHYQRIMELATQLGDLSKAIPAIGYKGWIELNRGKTKDARTFFDTGLSIAREAEDRAGEANMLNSIAACFVGRMDRQSMRLELDYYRRAREIWTELGDERNAISMEHNIGIVLRKQGRFREALRAFEVATGWMAEKGKNKIYQSIGLTTIAETLCFVGEYNRSAEVAEQAVAVAEEVGHKPYLAFARIGLGKTWFMQGRRQEAVELVRTAVELASRHTAEWEVTSGECALGEMLFEMGRREEARTSLQHVVRTAKDAAYDEFLIRAFGHLSAIQLLEDDVAFGRSRLRELIDRSADSYICVTLKRLLGMCQIEKPSDDGDRDAGIRLLEEAMTAARRMSFASEMDRIRAILATG